MSKSIEEKLQSMIPGNLDDIIRANRDKMSLRLATDNEIAGLYKPLIAPQTRSDITGWYIIARVFGEELRKHAPSGTPPAMFHLLGYRDGQTWITSDIYNIDLDAGLVLTRNSIYRLSGPRGEGEPDEDLLIHICAAFHQWGFGRDLGVPPFFY